MSVAFGNSPDRFSARGSPERLGVRGDLVSATDDGDGSGSSTSSVLAVKVTDYYFVGDGRSFDKHFFILAVSAENYNYTVDRSYVDFVEFDRLLRKKFPESNIGILPLEESRTVKKALQRDATMNTERKRSSLGSGVLTSTRNSLALTRESMIGAMALDGAGAGGGVFAIPDESREDIGSKRYLLDKYLQDLLLKHEIVGSDELLTLLDEERRGIVNADELEEPLNVHDLLLINVPVNKCVVHRTEEYQYHVPRGHLILWRFSTQYYDIGFSVEMNGAVKVPYTRCSSHKAPVCGILEVADPSICVLKWDNSYAKLRTKQLAWSVRVVSAEQFHTAKAQALDCQRERRRFEQQRFAVQRCAARAVASLQRMSGVVLLEGSVLQDHAQEENMHVRLVERELRRYKEEATTLLADLKRTEGCIETLQAQCQAAEETKHTFSGSWEFSASQLVLAELEIEDCNRIIEELSAEVADRDDELEQLDRDMAELERAVLLAEKARREQFGECTKELRAAERDTIRREKKLRERQQEYAELKAAIAQAAARKDASAGSSSSSAEQQQQYREERLCRLVEKLLEDVEKGNGEVERKNGVLRGIAEHIASTAAAAAAATSADGGDASDGHT